MARSARSVEIDGEGAFWAVAGFAASVLVGVALRPLRESAGLENVVVVYVIVVALTAAVGGIPSGHRRSVGGTLVLPAEGAVVDLVRGDRRVGALVIVPSEDRPILRTIRLGIAATAHALANAR